MFSFGQLSENFPQFQTRRALLVLDVQNDFLSVNSKLPISDPAFLTRNIRTLVPAFRQFGDVIWACSEFEDDRTVNDARWASENVITNEEIAKRIKDEEVTRMRPQSYRQRPLFERKKHPKSSTSLVKATERMEKISQRQADELQRLSPDAEEEDELFLSPSRSGRKPSCCLPNTSGAQISVDVLSVVDEERDTILVKTHYSAFNSTNLLASLRNNLVTELFISGLASNTAVYATTLDAVRHGYTVTLVEDCLGYRSKSRHDEAMLQMIEFMGAEVISTNKLVEDIKRTNQVTVPEKASTPKPRDATNQSDLQKNLQGPRLDVEPASTATDAGSVPSLVTSDSFSSTIVSDQASLATAELEQDAKPASTTSIVEADDNGDNNVFDVFKSNSWPIDRPLSFGNSYSGRRSRRTNSSCAARSTSATSVSPASAFLSKWSSSSSSAPEPDSEGQEVGEYVLGKQIGFGGFSTVKEAYTIEDDQRIKRAVKIVRKQIACKTERENDQFQAQFEHEVSLWRVLDHRHILSLIAVYDTPFAMFCFTKLNADGTLFDLVRCNRKGLEPRLAQRYAYQLASAIRYLHGDVRVVHRDIKLENCLLDMSAPDAHTVGGNVLLSDFGMAEFVAGEAASSDGNSRADTDGHGGRPLTRNIGPSVTSTSIVNSLQYASPELVTSDGHEVSLTAVDIWAFGVTVYALIVGNLPFQHPFQPKLHMMIMKGLWDEDDFKKGHGAAEVVNQALDLIKGCLERDVKERWNVKMVSECAWLREAKIIDDLEASHESDAVVSLPLKGKADINAREEEYDNTLHDSSETQVISADNASTTLSPYVPSDFSAKSVAFLPQNSAEELVSATGELVALLADDEVLMPLYSAALRNEKIGAERFEKNFHRLLKLYSIALKNQAHDALEKKAAQLVWARARYVANTIRRMFDQEGSKKEEYMKQLKPQETEPAKQVQLKRFPQLTKSEMTSQVTELNNVKGRSQNDESPGRVDRDISTRVEDQSLEESDWGQRNSDDPPSLRRVKVFMMSGNAFESLRQNLRQFVYVPCEVKSPKIIARQEEDLSHINPITTVATVSRVEEHINKLENTPCKLDGINSPDLENVISLSDNGRIVRFTPWTMVPSPGVIDRAKTTIETWIRHPINWWPFEPRKNLCPKGHTRLSWCCGCGTKLYVDIPTNIAKEYGQQCAPVALALDSRSLLPLHNTVSVAATSSTSTQTQNNDIGSSRITQRSTQQQNHKPSGPAIQGAQQAQLISNASKDRYIHWCVDVSKFETQLIHIPIISMNDVKFIHELKSAYNAVRGLRQYFSLTTCYGVKFVMFERIHRNKELVACGNEDLPCPRTNQEYEYAYFDPREQFIKTLEKSLMHHFHNPRGCGAQDIEDVLLRIPKKIMGKLENKFGVSGYGMHAVTGWALWKFFVALIFSQIGPLCFAIRWLCGHPGDLQNAFVLSMYLVGILNLVVVIPDIWNMRR